MISKFLKLTAVVLLLATSVLNAQTPSMPQAQQRGYTLKLQLVDASNNEVVSFATVSLTPEGGKTATNYALTDAEGKVTIRGIKKGKYLVKGELLGYENFEKEMTFEQNEDLGQIKMKVQLNQLESAVVTDVGNPIIVKKDTIEFNSASFKTTDNDMLEDLLKKLPGVEVSSDGSITANGKTISKITIDGKTFFLDDPQLASKNLPAKIINKVKVIEKKSEQAEFTGIDDGEEETVIDLSVAKGMMNGWFGNLMGGGGSDLRGVDEDGNAIDNDLRFQGAAMVAKFTESDQLAFIGNINNTNNRGFNDLAGSMMGGMRSGGMRGGMGGMGGRGNGISTSYMAGVNGGHTFDNKSEITGNYLFNGNEKVVEENTAKTTFKQDGSSLYATEDGYSETNTYGHRAGARADWKISKTSSILFEPQFNIGYGNFLETSDFATDNTSAAGVKSKVNDGYSLSSGDNSSQSASGRLLIRQRLGKPGRTISANINYSYSNNELDGVNYSVTDVYADDVFSDRTMIDQRYNSNSKTSSIGGRISYTEPLGKNFFVEGTYSYNFRKTDSKKYTYDKNADGEYNVLDEEYSNDIVNKYTSQRAGINFMKQEEKYNVTLGATAQPSRTINVTKVAGKETTIDQNVLNWAPNARFDYNFSDYKMLRLAYRGRSTQPTITQMQPVADNSNPQYITLGNPNLNPSFAHTLNTMYRTTKMETYSSFNVNLDVTYNQSNIVNASWYDASGVQYTVPMNNDKGTFTARTFIMYNTPIAKSKFSFMSFTNGSYSSGVSFVGKDGIDSEDPASYLDIANYTENDYQTVSFSENMRFVYRDNILELTLGGNARYSQAWYTVSSKNVNATWTNGVTASAIATISNIVNISTDGRYTFYIGYEDGYNEPTFVWNAEISKSILKNMMTVSLKAYDILNQSRNTYRTTTDNYVQDVQNNTLGRYIILSLTYRFGTFSGPRGGMRGHGGPGGPMGGGPGMR
ncbi:MAG: outer membrane beta-barrel family protein [Bacteroidales bacterium]|nr:outer membrane beta-barrel family protein [Bacteroidales bacterium]MDD3201059.1 outer membrane beta-barrel family protein [Bacteroidales bacterium]